LEEEKMIITRPVAARLTCNGRNSVHSAQVLESFVSRLTSSARAHSSISSACLRNSARNGSIGSKGKFGVLSPSIAREAVFRSRQNTQRGYATGREVITKFEDLPEYYTDFAGLPYGQRSINVNETNSLFGPGTDPRWADRLLRVLQGRRVAGTLEDPSLPPAVPDLDTARRTIALSWLRNNIPVDEQESAGLRAELELAAMEREAVARGEQIGLYKTIKDEADAFHHDKSGLEVLREVKKRQWDEKALKKEAERKAREAAIQQQTGTLAMYNERGVELRRPGQNPKLLHYIEQATKTAPQVLPEMSNWQRLWPSALVTIAVVLGSLVYSHFYLRPKKEARLWPNLPPAVAALAPLVAMNVLVFALWHHPPAWRILNKYFLSVPGYPRALAVLGNAFSHQKFLHLVVNMALVFLIGTRLHDNIGRANFFAVYLSSAVLGSMTSLTYHVMRRNFQVTSLGASTALAGIAAAYFYLHWDTEFRLFNVWPSPDARGIPGYVVLATQFIMEFWGLRKPVKKYDHVGHLGGAVGGLMVIGYLNQEAARRTAIVKRWEARLAASKRPGQDGK
jgi:rhomboid-like protein